MMTPEDFAKSGSLDSQFSPTQEPQPQIPVAPIVELDFQEPQDPVKTYGSGIVSERETQNSILASQEFAGVVVRNLRDARNVDPQDYVNAERMAKSLNISVDEVFKDKNLAVQLYREKQDMQNKLWDNAPELAKLLEDSAFAAKAQQALDQYSYLERTSLAWEQGGLTVRRGELGLKSLNSTLTDEERQELDDLNERMSILPAPAGEILPEAARIFGMQAEMSPETIGFGAVGALVGAGVGFFGGGGVGAAPGAAKGYFLASSAASAYKMYEIEAGNAYIDMIDEGVDPVQAADKATTIGLFNAAIELALAPIAGSGFRRLVNNQFVKRIAGDEAASETAKFLLLGRGFKNPYAQGAFDYAKALIAEPTEEAFQEMILEYGKHAAALASRPEYRAAMEGMGNAEQESQAAESFANAFWGMVAGGLVQGASGYYGTSNSITQRAERARSNGEQLQKMINTASNAKAVPALTRKLVTRLTEKHGNGDLSISVSDLLGVLDGMAAKASEGKAKPVTRDEMLAALRVADPDMGVQLDDAITHGGNGEVFVKTADFISKYVEKPTSEFYRQLVGHIRVIKDDATVPLSIMESKELLSKIDEIRRKEMEIIEREETPFRDAANGVRKQLSDLFATNTSMNEQERTASTDLLWTMAVVNARRTNTLPTLEFAGMPLQIAQEGKSITTEEVINILSSSDALKASITNQEALSSIGSIVSSWENDGVSASVDIRDGNIVVSKFVVPESKRGVGVGTAKMKELLSLADKAGMSVFLTPSLDFGASSKSRLVSFYKSLGFVPNKGKSKDFVYKETMVRPSLKVGEKPLLASVATQSGLEATAAYITALNKIILKKNATFREVAHEIGHMVLEDVVFRAKNNKSQEDVDIANAILEWLGVTAGQNGSRIANWDSLPMDVKTEMHERLAYSYERYLETHKAPTKKLEGLFQRMSSILRGFWRNVKNGPAMVYRKIFGKELPILSSDAARALDLKLSLAHEIERSDIVAALSEVGMNKEEALAAGLNEAEWANLQKLKTESVEASIDYAVSRQLGNAAYYSKKFRAAHEKYQRFVNKVREKIFGEERDKLLRESVYNLRNWAETGKAFDDQGNLVEITDGQSHKLNAAEVRAAHDKMVESLSYEIAQSMARIKRLDATKDAAEIKRLEDYIKLAKSVIKIDTLPALMSAHKVFILAKNAFADSQKTIEQFKEELLMGMVATALRTVRRSPLYVFRNIRSLIRANDDGKLNRQEVEDIIYSLLIEGSELNGFRASARIIAGAARKAERNLRVGYAKTAKDILDAFRIEFTLEAIEGTKAEQTKRIQARIEKLELKLATLVARHGEAKKKVQGTDKRNAKQIEKEMRAIQGEINTAREEWNRITTEVMEDTGKPKSQRVRKGSDIPNLPAEIAQMVDQLETLREEYDNLTRTGVVNGPMSEEVYNKILDVQVRLNKALAKEATGRLNKEMIKRIEADAAEQVEVNYPEFHGKLKASDVNAAVMEEVNRRVARYIMSKFLDGMVSDTGVAVAPYHKQSAEKTGNAKSFVLALIMAQQRGNQEEDVARERAEARLNNEFGKAATKMHVNASAKKLIADAIQEEKVLEAYSDYIAEDGMPIDFVREMFGYEDNDSMLIDLLTAQDIDDAALDNTDKRVKTMPELSNRKEIDRIVGEALANDMRVDIMKEEIKAIQTALQRMFEAGLTPEEKAKREAKRDAAMNQMKALQAERDDLKKKQAGFKAVGDTKSADAAFNRIKSLNAEIRKLAVVAGAPLVTASEIRESAEHLAKSRMSEKLVREVKPTLFLTAARRAAHNAIRAMKGASTSKDKAGKQKDDYLVAYLDAKLDEMVNEMMWREAMKAERSRQKDKDFIATLFGDKNEIASDRDFNMVLAARAVAIIYGLRRGNMDEAVKAVEDIKVTDPKLYPYISQMVSVAMFEASDASFKSLKNRIVRATEEEADTKQLPPIYEELTMEQYSRLMSNMRYMWAEAKRLRELEDKARADLAKAIRDGALKTLLERLKLTEQFKERMSKLPIIGRWFAPKGSELADRATLPSALEEFLIKNMKMESFFLELDNDTPGWWTKNVWRPLSNANVDYSMRVAVYYEKYLALIEPIKDKLNEARTIAAPELTDKDGVAHVFGRDGGRGLGELFWLLTHIGDYGGYRRMIVGSGWGTITDGVLDDSKFVAFFEKAKTDGLITDEMLEIIQNIGDLFEELRPEYKRVYMLAKRQPSVDVPVREVVGVKKKFKGWYMPAVISPKERETRVVGQDLDSALLALSEESTGNSAPFLPTNRGKDRNENYEQNAKALSADHLFIPQAFEQLIRFIHFYEPMSRVTTLLKGEGVADALNQYRPGIVMKGLLPWLQDIASRSGSKSSGDVARLMTQIRTAVVGTQMFGNIKVALENVTGLFPALLEVEAKHVMRAIKRINFSPLKAKEDISNKSKFMRLYHKESMMELAMEIVNFVKKGGKLESVQEWTRKNATWGVKQSQAWVSDIVWTAKYNEVLANAGPNAANMEEEAIEQADSAVRLTQNSFRIEDKTVYERGTEMAKFAFTYTGWFNMIRQLYSRKVKNSLLNDSLGKATAKTGVYFISAYTIPSLLSAYIAAELYDKLDDDDEEKRDQFINEMVWGATLRTVLSGFPPIGSLAMQAIDAQAGKNYGRGAGENPIVGGLYRQLESLIKLVSLPVSDRDWTGRDTRNIVDAMSAALGIPSAGRPIGYIQALATDETETTGIIDFVRGLATGAYQK